MRISKDNVTSINGYQAKKCSCGADWITLKRGGSFIRVCTNKNCILKTLLPIKNWKVVKKSELPKETKEEIPEGFE